MKQITILGPRGVIFTTGSFRTVFRIDGVGVGLLILLCIVSFVFLIGDIKVGEFGLSRSQVRYLVTTDDLGHLM